MNTDRVAELENLPQVMTIFFLVCENPGQRQIVIFHFLRKTVAPSVMRLMYQSLAMAERFKIYWWLFFFLHRTKGSQHFTFMHTQCEMVERVQHHACVRNGQANSLAIKQ